MFPKRKLIINYDSQVSSRFREFNSLVIKGKIKGGLGVRKYGEISKASVFVVLTSRPLVLIHCKTLESSVFARTSKSVSVSAVIERAVSSAKNLGRVCKQEGRSLI